MGWCSSVSVALNVVLSACYFSFFKSNLTCILGLLSFSYNRHRFLLMSVLNYINFQLSGFQESIKSLLRGLKENKLIKTKLHGVRVLGPNLTPVRR